MNKLEIQILRAINPHFEDGDGDAMIADLSKLILEIADKSFDAGIEWGLDLNGKKNKPSKAQYLSELSGNKPTCPKCGYSKEDQQIHGDHHLCTGEIPN